MIRIEQNMAAENVAGVPTGWLSEWRIATARSSADIVSAFCLIHYVCWNKRLSSSATWQEKTHFR
jgi:hypothetical protein